MRAPRKSFSALAENFGPPLVFLAVTLIFIVAAYGYPPASREVPLLIGYALIVLIALDILSRTSTSTGELVRRYLNPASGLPGVPKTPGDESEEHPSGQKELLAVGWVAAFTAAVMIVGILPAVPAYVASYMIIEGRKSVKFSILIAASIALFLWLSFEMILSIPLYRGMLFE